MNLPLDQQIDAAHHAAEAAEAQAREIEARMRSVGVNPPARRYGQPVNISGNLTVRGQLQLRDPALAAYLNVPGDLARREAEAQAQAAAAAERMQALTEQARQRNQAAAEQRYRQQLNPLPSGWRAR